MLAIFCPFSKLACTITWYNFRSHKRSIPRSISQIAVLLRVAKTLHEIQNRVVFSFSMKS
ncbi:MAG: hypothetical protein DME56_06365 [Verrucomicrobia bacterium]|nr:MAG: hypothetical protein DME56_06365 [Verrucomicrobiota bacterium]